MKRYFYLVLSIILILANAYTQMAHAKNIVKMRLQENLTDTFGNLTGGALSRVSATTYIHYFSDLLTTAWGDRDQLIDPSGQNDITDASWDAQTRMGNSTANALIADTNNATHFFADNSAGMTANGTYILSLSAKAGEEDWISVSLRDDTGFLYTFFDLNNGQVGATDSNSYSGISGPDGNGFYRCYIVRTIGAVTSQDRVYIHAAEGNNDNSFAGDNTNASIYIKEIMLEELPSGNTISAELMPNQVDRDFSGASAWTNNDINSYDETTDLTIIANAADQYCNIATASVPMTQNEWYLLQFDVANLVSGWTISDNDAGFTIGTIDADAGGDGTYQFHFKYTDATGGGLTITSNDADSSGDFDNFSLKNTPEFTALIPSDYVNSATVPAKARFESEGLLLEGEATNLLEYSEDFSQWIKLDVGDTHTLDSPGPDGVSNSAYSLIADASGGSHGLNSVPDLTLADNTTYTFSVFAKRGNQDWVCLRIKKKSNANDDTWFDLSNGVVGTDGSDGSGIESIDGSWYRIWIATDILTGSTAPYALLLSADEDNSLTFTGDASTINTYIYGAQLEETPYPTSYIPTDGCEVTRTTDAGASGSTGVSWTMSAAVMNAIKDGTIAGTLVVRLIPGYDDADTTAGNHGFVSCESGLTSLLYHYGGDASFRSYDGTTLAKSNASTVIPTSGDDCTAVLRWSDALNQLTISENCDGTWRHGTTQALDADGFDENGSFWLHYGNEYPAHYNNIYILDEYLTDAEVEREAWAGRTRGPFRMGMGLH